jgi:hypothetical protein
MLKSELPHEAPNPVSNVASSYRCSAVRQPRGRSRRAQQPVGGDRVSHGVLTKSSENSAAQCEVLHTSKVDLDGIIVYRMNSAAAGDIHFQFALRAVLALKGA